MSLYARFPLRYQVLGWVFVCLAAGAGLFASHTSAQTQTALQTGDLLNCPRNGAVYYLASDSKKYLFPNVFIYYTWYTNFNSVKNLSCEDLDAIPTGETRITAHPGTRLIQFNHDTKIYAVSRGALLRFLPDDAIAQALYGENWQRHVIVQPWQTLALYEFGEPLANAADYNRFTEFSQSPTVDTELRFRGVIQDPRAVRAPVCSNDLWNCTDWDACVPPGTQTRSCTLIFNCPNAQTEAPAQTQSCSLELETENRLQALSGDFVAALSPAFSPDVTTYSLTRSFEHDRIVLSPRIADSATIAFAKVVNGNRIFVSNGFLDTVESFTFFLEEGQNVLDVIVKAEDGTERTYRFTITRLGRTCSADTWTCADWNACAANGTQTRSCAKSFDCPHADTPSPQTSQSCTPGGCTEDRWECTDWGVCSPLINQQFRSCHKTFDCPNVNTPEPQRAQTCTPAVACTQDVWACGDWGACGTDGDQDRTCVRVIDCPNVNTPAPQTKQSCTFDAPGICQQDLWTCADWSGCLNNIQTRLCTKSFECTRANTSAPLTRRACQAPSTPPSTPPPSSGGGTSCRQDVWACSTWGECLADGTERRTCTRTVDCPGDRGVNPRTVRTCTTTGGSTPPPPGPTCTQDTWTCNAWSACDPTDRVRRRECNISVECPAVNTPSPAETEACDPTRDQTSCTQDTWNCSEWGACSSNSRQTRTCTKSFDCTRANTAQPSTSRSCTFVPPTASCPVPNFVAPPRTSEQTTNRCIWERPDSRKELRLGETTLPSVWNEGPFDVRIPNKEMALGIGAAAAIFNVEPNYFVALATKESKMQAFPAGNPQDGYFQIENGTAMAELRLRWGTSHFRNADHQAIVHDWSRAAMTVGFYNHLTEAFFAQRNYRVDDFQDRARDLEAKTKFINYAFNRGQYGGALPVERTLTTDLRITCADAEDVLSCMPGVEEIGRDHTQSVVSYCRALKGTNNIYDNEIGWIDVQNVMNNTILPFFDHLSTEQKRQALIRAENMFTCLKGDDASISYRYEYATLMEYVAEALPLRAPTL